MMTNVKRRKDVTEIQQKKKKKENQKGWLLNSSVPSLKFEVKSGQLVAFSDCNHYLSCAAKSIHSSCKPPVKLGPESIFWMAWDRGNSTQHERKRVYKQERTGWTKNTDFKLLDPSYDRKSHLIRNTKSSSGFRKTKVHNGSIHGWAFQTHVGVREQKQLSLPISE